MKQTHMRASLFSYVQPNLTHPVCGHASQTRPYLKLSLQLNPFQIHLLNMFNEDLKMFLGSSAFMCDYFYAIALQKCNIK